MPDRALRALVLLLLVGCASLAGLVTAAGCADECEPGCGDCPACPLLADLPSPPEAFGLSCRGGAPGSSPPAPPPPPVRPPDHVPLVPA